MSRGILAVAVVVLAVGGAGVLLVGDLPTGANPGPGAGDVTTTGTTTGTSDSVGDQPDDSGGSTTSTPSTTRSSPASDAPNSPYALTIEKIEECGSTCRDVTARLANTGHTTRQNVRATTKVYADGDLLWTGNETIGTLAGDESHTSTKRVDVGLAGGMAIQNNDGYVTIVTVVRSDGETVQFENRRKVS